MKESVCLCLHVCVPAGLCAKKRSKMSGVYYKLMWDIAFLDLKKICFKQLIVTPEDSWQILRIL